MPKTHPLINFLVLLVLLLPYVIHAQTATDPRTGLSSTAKCTKCLKNTFQSGNVCEPCPEGTYSGEASTTCTDCGDGYEINDNGDCVECPVGYFSTAAVKAYHGNQKCIPCTQCAIYERENCADPVRIRDNECKCADNNQLFPTIEGTLSGGYNYTEILLSGADTLAECTTCACQAGQYISQECANFYEDVKSYEIVGRSGVQKNVSGYFLAETELECSNCDTCPLGQYITCTGTETLGGSQCAPCECTNEAPVNGDYCIVKSNVCDGSKTESSGTEVGHINPDQTCSPGQWINTTFRAMVSGSMSYYDTPTVYNSDNDDPIMSAVCPPCEIDYTTLVEVVLENGNVKHYCNPTSVDDDGIYLADQYNIACDGTTTSDPLNTGECAPCNNAADVSLRLGENEEYRIFKRSLENNEYVAFDVKACSKQCKEHYYGDPDNGIPCRPCFDQNITDIDVETLAPRCEPGYYRPMCTAGTYKDALPPCEPCGGPQRKCNVEYYLDRCETSYKQGGETAGLLVNECKTCSPMECPEGEYYRPCAGTDLYDPKLENCRDCTYDRRLPANSYAFGRNGNLGTQDYCLFACNLGFYNDSSGGLCKTCPTSDEACCEGLVDCREKLPDDFCQAENEIRQPSCECKENYIEYWSTQDGKPVRECDPCTGNKVPNEDRTVCGKCPSGSEGELTTGSSVCVRCAPYTYRTDSMTGSCVPCKSGYTNNGTECTTYCGDNEYVPAEGGGCIPCASGLVYSGQFGVVSLYNPEQRTAALEPVTA